MPQTGPKGPRGKAVVSRNAEKHGVLSTTPVLDIEDPAEWDAHLRGMIDSLQPEGHHETVLVHNMATYQWRKSRVVRYETEMISLHTDYERERETLQLFNAKSVKEVVDLVRNDRKRREFIATRLIPGEMTGPMIMRYEAHLHRLYTQTLHELEAVQTRRQGGTSPLTRFDITGAPGG
ncbi:MAG TPA: hypothetical protein VIP09_14100 [Dehalococcoidia bacterium]|jgi:hypothetical protein